MKHCPRFLTKKEWLSGLFREDMLVSFLTLLDTGTEGKVNRSLVTFFVANMVAIPFDHTIISCSGHRRQSRWLGVTLGGNPVLVSWIRDLFRKTSQVLNEAHDTWLNTPLRLHLKIGQEYNLVKYVRFVSIPEIGEYLYLAVSLDSPETLEISMK